MMPGPGGKNGNSTERRQRAEVEQLKLALAEATVQLRIWRLGAEHVHEVPSETSRPLARIHRADWLGRRVVTDGCPSR